MAGNDKNQIGQRRIMKYLFVFFLGAPFKVLLRTPLFLDPSLNEYSSITA